MTQLVALPTVRSRRSTSDALSRIVRACYDHLTFAKCLAYALVVYVIVSMTAVERLTNSSIRAKARIAATLLAPATRPAEATASRWRALEPAVSAERFIFHSTPVEGGSLDAAETERRFLQAATDVSGIAEDDPAFLDALARFNFFAESLRGSSYGERPWYAEFVGSHEYQGCSVSVPAADGPALRASAALFLRYADPFADTFPWTQASAGADTSLAALVGPTNAKPARASAFRSIPLSVTAAPWRLFAFRDGNFAMLCDGLPKATLFLCLAFSLSGDLRYRSVGRGGVFAFVAEPAPWTVRILWALILGLPLVVIASEGRETPLEALRLIPMFGVTLIAAGLIHCLDAVRGSEPSRAFLELDLKSRRNRLLPFAIGAACLISAAAWGIAYSLFSLVLRFEFGSIVRGLAQAAALAWMLWLVYAILRRLVYSPRVEPLNPPDAATAPREAATGSPAPGRVDETSSPDLCRELAKALALVLSPLASHLLGWFASL